MIVVIKDELHAESQGSFPTLDAALTELRRRATIPWNQAPNLCTCLCWETCHRDLAVIEYDNSVKPWKVLRRWGYLEISSEGVFWSRDFKDGRIQLRA